MESSAALREFSKEELVKLEPRSRDTQCTRLQRLLTSQMRSDQQFHDKVASIVSQLRSIGHDLLSYDESDETEVWGPDYQNPSGPGLVITFHPDDVNVEWSTH